MDDRTYLAGCALQGLLANPSQNVQVWDVGLTDVALGYADDMIRLMESSEDHHTTTARPHSNDPEAPEPVQEPAQETQEMPAHADTTLRDLGVSGRACAPLERMGVETLGQLAVQSRKDISSVRGVSTDTLKQFDSLLEEHGLSWDWSPAETVSEDDGDDEDDLL